MGLEYRVSVDIINWDYILFISSQLVFSKNQMLSELTTEVFLAQTLSFTVLDRQLSYNQHWGLPNNIHGLVYYLWLVDTDHVTRSSHSCEHREYASSASNI